MKTINELHHKIKHLINDFSWDNVEKQYKKDGIVKTIEIKGRLIKIKNDLEKEFEHLRGS